MVSTKGRYALRVLIDLAEHQTDGYIPLKDTAARQEISEKYLEGIIKILVKAKLLEGVRGKGGGYRLTKAPEQYTVGSILRLTENSMAPVACLEPGSTDCPRMGSCKTLPLAGSRQSRQRILGRRHHRRPRTEWPARGRLCNLATPQLPVCLQAQTHYFPGMVSS